MSSRLGRFEIQAEIGRGGFGQVFRAYDPVVNRVVAVKVLTETEDASSFNRFKNEATAAGNLHHDNIVTIYEFGQEGNRIFLVMEYLDGKDLQQILKSAAPLSLYQKIRIMDQVADGLHCAHRNGVFHRDVKPANIMVMKGDAVKVMDFGIARLMRDTSTRLTQQGFLIGTIVFMAPELFTGTEFDALCDVWSYGVVFYELLTGKNPFQTGNFQSEMYRILNQDAEPLPADAGPAELQPILSRLLCRQREYRYQSLEDVRLDLQPILKSLEEAEAERLLSKAQELMVGQKWQEALSTLREVRRMDPSSGEGRLLYDRAQSELRRQARGSRIDEALRRSHDAAEQQKFAGAITILEEARKLEPDNQEILRRLEELRSTKGRLDEEAQRVRHAHPELLNNLQATATPSSDNAETTRLIRIPTPVGKQPPDPTEPQRQRRNVVRDFLARLWRRFTARGRDGESAVRGAQQGVDAVTQPEIPLAPAREIAEVKRITDAAFEFKLKQQRDQAIQIAAESEAARKIEQAAPVPVSQPGTFTDLFSIPAKPPPPFPELAQESTRMFRTQPESSTPVAPPPAAPGEFTQILPSPNATGGLLPTQAHDPFLVIASAADPIFIGRRANLHLVPFRIGRDVAEVQFPLTFDEAVSGVHAEIDFSNGGYVLRDLDSTNGTFVSGRRVCAGGDEPLYFGARILLGSNTLLVFSSNEIEEIPDLTGLAIANGRFVLQKRIHPGARSAVYAAHDEHLGCLVAIKILSPKLANYPGYREQFQREAATASRLLHSNICPVLDHGETEVPGHSGRWLYVAMKHLDGGNLSQRLGRNERFDLATIAAWLDRICSALDHMHQKGVVHSGIKPSAIVFDADGNPYLTDFAFASRPGATDPRGVIGAPSFLAPEQWEGDPPTPATDQYSLGVLMYWTIAGSLPMEGQENPAVREINLQRDPLPVREMALRNGREDVPAGISPVVQRAMARKPEDRFPSAGEFAREFRTGLHAPVAPAVTAPPLIFISYHRPTSKFLALLIQRELEKHGWKVFLDSQQRDTVGRFTRKIELNIERSDVFVCILGEKTLESPWVNREIEKAVACSKPMIPIFQEGFDENAKALPPHVMELVAFDGIRLVDTQSYYIDAFMKWLVDSVQQILKAGGTGASAP